MLFFDRQVCDYEVIGKFNKIGGEQVVTKRVCHNVSRREAIQRMRLWVQAQYSDSLDVHHPIKINAKSMQNNLRN
ncbi:hypothetical protein MOO45_01490 [Bombilactobacillus folatiphilus]|uniref:Uncharacterized protein n=1 Tax=Bombilactobacillus folatiphilus TaxID=2923362 RepID=A0ABY4P9N2_9LACO|nr:hypothetical protein [Bombilactobacillus folatiphilus]UQS82388.1 hypothetical protein MOO45_01490 [Bombilactobacillus folatiphilus]